MKVKVLGPGCKNCSTLKQNVEAAAQKNGWDMQLEYITDPAEIASHGIMRTPGLIFEDEIVSMGKVLAPSQIEALWAQRQG